MNRVARSYAPVLAACCVGGMPIVWTGSSVGHTVVARTGIRLYGTEEDLKGIGERIGNAVVPGIGSKIIGDHGKVTPFQIDGKWVYALKLRDEDGSRCTLNFDAKWNGPKTFNAYLVAVPAESRLSIMFQRKGDKKWNSDSNRGSVFKHGDTVQLDGSKNYLAERNRSVGEILKDNPNAVVLLVEDGLSLSRVLESIKDK